MERIIIPERKMRAWAITRNKRALNNFAIAKFLKNNTTNEQKARLMSMYVDIFHRLLEYRSNLQKYELGRFACAYNFVTKMLLDDIEALFGEETRNTIEDVITFFSVETYLAICNAAQVEPSNESQDGEENEE